MKLTSIILKENIIPRLESRDRHEVLREISRALVKSEPGLNAEEVYNYLEKIKE